MKNITVSGASTHNLKNVNIAIPRNSLVVFTGVSGSGKTSLAFDTIFAEGQRRYFETLSAYSRQFVAELQRPDVDLIEGLSPAISVSQKGMPNSPRSTVGTLTEIYDYLRLLYTAIGKPACPDCGIEITSTPPDKITNLLIESMNGAFVYLLAPLIIGRKGVYKDLIEKVSKMGFSRLRVDGELYHLDDEIPMSRYKAHNIELVVDRLQVTQENRERLLESLVTCAREGKGAIIVHDRDRGVDTSYSTTSSCPNCGYGVPKISPRTFSFNHPSGACPVCGGIGDTEDFVPSLLIPNLALSLMKGGIVIFSGAKDSYDFKLMSAALEDIGADVEKPIADFTLEQRAAIFDGTGNKKYRVRYRAPGGRWRFATAAFPGLTVLLRKKLDTASPRTVEKLQEYIRKMPCRECGGARLKRESLSIRIAGKNIADLSMLPVSGLAEYLDNLSLKGRDYDIGAGLLNEVRKRIGFLIDVGLSYLSLNRTAMTLSGGEYQRVRLAAHIGTYLSGVTYVLDEPSVGLHARDSLRLLGTLEELRELGNSVLVVEHDEQTIRRADYVVDMGPGAGRLGGFVVAAGKAGVVEKSPDSLTGKYLSGELSVTAPSERRKPNGKELRLLGAAGNNLKKINAVFPLGLFICLTGVSGSGKSSLALDTLLPAVRKALNLVDAEPLAFDKLKGIENINRVLFVDTAPIGKTPRSTPATYTGVFDFIRKLFAALPEARARGYKVGRFSYNVKGGRCEACEGNGSRRIEMHFLPDVFVNCETCGGKRFNNETLEVTFKGKSIADILEMTFEEAFSIFENIPYLKKRLEVIKDIGLDYLLLGQPAPTLSTGEAQRIKLATELQMSKNTGTLYLLDEPTTGLHFSDIQKLLNIIDRLVGMGNTVIVVEHNMDVIKCADWIIDLGPEGGEAGGSIIAQGAPEIICKSNASHTGRFLKEYM